MHRSLRYPRHSHQQKDAKIPIQNPVYALLLLQRHSLLDADAFPLQPPEEIFNSEPFLSHHLITFPDFWATTVSPLFYEITSQDIPLPNTRQSTESGEVFISRRTHLHTLLLSTYYNFWGPDYYYPLLSQGASGEGDKETFLAAATVAREPFYQVSDPIRALGRHMQNGEFAGSTMIQYDPRSDYSLTTANKWRAKGDSPPVPEMLFVHANFPKFNPVTLFTDNAPGPVVKEDGGFSRAWTAPEEIVSAFERDLERDLWREIKWTACALQGRFTGWRGNDWVCRKVGEYWDDVFGGD